MEIEKNLLKQKKGKALEGLVTVSQLFQSKAPKVKPEEEVPESEAADKQGNTDQPEENPFVDQNMSMIQKKEREGRTVFVGNIDLKAKQQEISKEFQGFGKIESVWMRSLPVIPSKKMTVKQRVLSEKEGAQTKNCYILFSKKEEAENALKANGKEFMGLHMRVDLAGQKQNDYVKTIFIGNLPFNITEEEVRAHFLPCGEIENVRVIRDPQTHQGKGFGYVHFSTLEGFKNAMSYEQKTLKNRELRIKKAVTTDRLEKKKRKQAEKETEHNKMNAQKRIEKKNKKKLRQFSKPEADEGQQPKKNKKRQEQDEDLKSSSAHAFVENDMNMNEIDNFQFQNKLSVPPRILRKKIKKLDKKNPNAEKKFKEIGKFVTKFHQKNDKNIFNSESQLKKRREKREKKREQNKQKVKMMIKQPLNNSRGPLNNSSAMKPQMIVKQAN